MQRRLYVTGIEKSTGKSFVSLGLLSALFEQKQSLRCYKLFSEQDNNQFPLLEMITNQTVSPVMSIQNAISMARETPEDLISGILDKIKNPDDGLCYIEGSNFDSDQDTTELQLNLSVAAQLNCEVLLVLSAKNRTIEHTFTLLDNAFDIAKRQHAHVIGVIINRMLPDLIPKATPFIQQLQKKIPLVTLLPEFEQLSSPTVREIAKKLNAKALYGQADMHRSVQNFSVAAKTLCGFLESRLDRNDMLIITPSDRTDILLGTLLAHQSAFYPKIAGIVLTGAEMPSPTICKIVEGLEHPFPVLLTDTNTYDTATTLYTAKFSLNIDDFDKVRHALEIMRPHFNDLMIQLLKLKRIEVDLSPAVFLHELMKKAARNIRHIVLPEGEDPRILKAASYLLKRRLVRLTLLGNLDMMHRQIKRLDLDLSQAHLLDYSISDKIEQYAQKYYELRQHKNINIAIARERMQDPNFYAAMMVYFGDADGMVSGAVHTTADTVRSALEIIKTKPGISRVSSVFIMCLPTRVLVYGDCAINPDPDAALLAEIAIQAADMAQKLGFEPKAALLSYSSGRSGKGASVDKVAEAIEIVKQQRPQLLIEGPIQYDAAVDLAVAKTKLPHSKIAGKANVLIFPDLNTGNNTYKAVQRETGALAIGPVLLGLKKPVSDLSRGCTPQDIINTILITALQVE